MCRECERRPAVVCAPPVAAPAGCASCAALTARVAELEAELSAHRARESEAGRAATLADVPREVVPQIFECAALQKENARLRDALALAKRLSTSVLDRELIDQAVNGVAAAAQGGGSV